jgi:methylenetetrahydrofolate/methylenetetrahydromethanopterin dehydrogenase (NADP+)
MKKLLLQLDSDKHPSAFDRIVPFDAGADEVLSYGGVTVEDVPGLIQGAFFTRGIKDLKNTAVWIGGSDVPTGERLLEAAKRSFFGPFNVSLMLDSNGSNTTAAAAVRKLIGATDVQGKRAVVLAGTGPVGFRGAMLLAMEGADVVLTSRRQDRAEEAAARLKEAGFRVTPMAVSDESSLMRAMEDVVVLLAAGAAGAQMITQQQWSSVPTLKAMADVNAVPPAGIEGLDMNDNGADRGGVIAFGPIGVGGFKMKVHKACIARLFERNDLVLDTQGVYEVARELG